MAQFITNGGSNRIQSNPVVGRLSKRIGGITMESRPFCHEDGGIVGVERKQVVNQYGPDIAAISLVGPCGVLIYSYFPVIHTGS